MQKALADVRAVLAELHAKVDRVHER